MSLTKRLKSKSFKNLKEWYKHYFASPSLGKIPKDIILPEKQSSSYSGDIGTAFDYLFRFKLQFLNKNIKGETSPASWVAFKALMKLPDNLKEKALKVFEQVVFDYTQLTVEGKVTTSTFESCIFLNYLDIYFRTGIVAEDIFSQHTTKVNELKRLYENVSWEQFKTNKSCYLNPGFNLPTGDLPSDGDVIIGDALIDIKCTKSVKIERYYLNQLLGYYFLDLLSEKNNYGQINKIGIYFARADLLWTIKLSEFFTKKEYKILAKEFYALIKDPTLQFDPSSHNIKPKKRLMTSVSEERLNKDLLDKVLKKLEELD